VSQSASNDPIKPHGFQTLRGALTGHEPDEAPYFAYSASLRIFGDQLDLGEITQQLGLIPTTQHRKGEQRTPHAPVYQHDLWAYQPPIPEEQPLAVHIDALWAAIKHATTYLRELKHVATVDVFLGYRSNIDHAGIEVPATSLNMFVELAIPFGLSIIITD
jgi:Domain of unknown function (DUF4279)